MGCLLLNSKKGQLNSIDFLIAAVVFMFLLVFFVGYWYVSAGDLQNTITRNRLESLGVTITDNFVKSPGVPSNWTDNTSFIQSVGFVSSQNILAESKLENFTNLDYNISRTMLGLSTAQGFYFYVDDVDGDRRYQSGNSSTSGQVISITRAAILNGEKVKVRLIVYE